MSDTADKEKPEVAPAKPIVEVRFPPNFFQKATVSRVISTIASNATLVTIITGLLYGGAKLYADEYIDGIIKDKRIVLIGDLSSINQSIETILRQQQTALQQQQEFENSLNSMQRNDAVDRSKIDNLIKSNDELTDDFKEVNRDIKSILRALQRQP